MHSSDTPTRIDASKKKEEERKLRISQSSNFLRLVRKLLAVKEREKGLIGNREAERKKRQSLRATGSSCQWKITSEAANLKRGRERERDAMYKIGISSYMQIESPSLPINCM